MLSFPQSLRSWNGLCRQPDGSTDIRSVQGKGNGYERIVIWQSLITQRLDLCFLENHLYLHSKNHGSLGR